MTTKPGIVVAGSIAQKPWHGGHTWVFLQYLLGFRKLGWDVLFLDQVDSTRCVDSDGQPCKIEDSVNLRYFQRVMNAFDLSGALLTVDGAQSFGLARRDVLQRVSRAQLLLNIMGFLRDEEILSRSQQRVFLDIDPGFSQMWHELGLQQMFDGYDAHVTIGMNIGEVSCEIPTCGIRWIRTNQPVVLDYWHPQAEADRGFTSVASWRGAYGPVPFGGKTYGLRVHEFRKFATLPRLATQSLEVALDIHSADTQDRTILENNGWLLVDPRVVAGDPWQFQSYVQRSSGEFMVAKNMYVETRSGWLSDRTICYLASGKPVLVQDTGLKNLYPLGKGLVAFTTVDDAAGGLENIARSYREHAAAAHEIAVDYFDSNKVLSAVVDKLGVN